MKKYQYLLEKIQNEEFQDKPFKHLYIENFFNKEDFNEIINSPQIKLKNCFSDNELFNELTKSGYGIISFPGTTDNFREYENWHKNKKRNNLVSSATDSFGIVFRMESPDEILKDLFNFIGSEEFNATLAEKFNIPINNCTYDNGIQKYLDGYEISPHPDIRRKALTFMVNINPNYSKQDYNTHYLRFKEEFKYVQSFWEGNPDIDRCWVPWSWCESIKTQSVNNSIVVFSPSNDTIHAVKANYDHLNSQRTQLYGNIWYNENSPTVKPEWEEFDIINNIRPRNKNILRKIKNKLFRNEVLNRNLKGY